MLDNGLVVITRIIQPQDWRRILGNTLVEKVKRRFKFPVPRPLRHKLGVGRHSSASLGREKRPGKSRFAIVSHVDRTILIGVLYFSVAREFLRSVHS